MFWKVLKFRGWRDLPGVVFQNNVRKNLKSAAFDMFGRDQQILVPSQCAIGAMGKYRDPRPCMHFQGGQPGPPFLFRKAQAEDHSCRPNPKPEKGKTHQKKMQKNKKQEIVPVPSLPSLLPPLPRSPTARAATTHFLQLACLNPKPDHLASSCGGPKSPLHAFPAQLLAFNLHLLKSDRCPDPT